jgi:TfoX/Sxy family transcriptional regulator of competence genes
MAYDQEVADGIRKLVAGEPGVTEMKMFGGIAFLIGGNMAVAASGHGGVMVRVDPADSAKLTSTTKAYEAVMRGRPMRGWLRVDAEHVHSRPELAKWVKRGTAYARSLPPK